MSDTSKKPVFSVIRIYREPTDAEIKAGITSKGGRVLDTGLEAKVDYSGMVFIDDKFQAEQLAKQITQATGLFTEVTAETVKTVGEWLQRNNHKLLKAMEAQQNKAKKKVK